MMKKPKLFPQHRIFLHQSALYLDSVQTFDTNKSSLAKHRVTSEHVGSQIIWIAGVKALLLLLRPQSICCSSSIWADQIVYWTAKSVQIPVCLYHKIIQESMIVSNVKSETICINTTFLWQPCLLYITFLCKWNHMMTMLWCKMFFELMKSYIY